MVKRWQLDNGLWLVAEPMDHVRSVAVGIWVGVGSLNETKEENGLSHFIEHMVFKGTKKRSARDFAQQMDEVGGNLNAFTGKDCTCFYAKVIDEDLHLAVDILADLTRNGVFDPKELEKERGVIVEEIAMVDDTPEDLVHDLLAKAQFEDEPLGRTILGPAGQIKNYSRQALLDYQHTHYVPENTVVAVAGHYDEETLLALVKEYFGDWEKRAFTPPAIPKNFYNNQLFKEKDTEQVQICFGYEGASSGSDESYAMAVLNNIVGGGMSSRLFQKIREDMGMAYSVYSYPISYKHTGVFNVYAGTAPENALPVMKEILTTMKDLAQNGVTQEEFASSKNQLKGSFLLGLESVSGRMQGIGRSQLLLGSVKEIDETLAAIEAVTFEDVSNLCRSRFNVAPAMAVVGPKAEKLVEVLKKDDVWHG